MRKEKAFGAIQTSHGFLWDAVYTTAAVVFGFQLLSEGNNFAQALNGLESRRNSR